MHEPFKDIFAPEAHEHVEDWYNLGATGAQRDLFRSICGEIYKADPNAPDPANRAPYTLIVEREEADLMVKYFTSTLTDLGKRKTRSWILHSTNSRRRESFRDVFAGCQTVFQKKSVMQKDYTPPEQQYYIRDNTYYHRSVDWTSLRARKNMQELQMERDGSAAAAANAEKDGTTCDLQRRPSAIAAERLGKGKPRFTKPKNQFDGVSNLKDLGYPDDIPAEVVIEQLKAKHKAFVQEHSYYTDKDGCTVYVAANAGPNSGKAAGGAGAARTVAGGGILASVTSDPISQWKVKVVDY